VRLIEIRLYDGPNVYRLEPVVKLELGLGPRRSWSGRRDPGPHALVRLGAAVPRTQWPAKVARAAGWAERLSRADAHPDRGASARHRRVSVHRPSDPGHWIVAWPWAHHDRSRRVAEAAFELAERGVDPARRARHSRGEQRLMERWRQRIAAAEGPPPAWLRDADRHVPIVSISGTNGKSTTTRLLTRILRSAGRHVGTTTSDGVLVDEVMVDPGDWTGPGGAKEILGRPGLDVAVLETARGGMLLRGLGYESNDASVLTNVSADHLDLQGIHTLPELAEVKATICRITKPDGWVVLNADDPHVAATGRSVRGRVAWFTLLGARSRRVTRHLKAGGRAYLVRDGELGEAEGSAWRPIARLAEIPIAFGGVARHNVANALAAAGGARAMGASIDEVRAGLLTFDAGTATSPGRLNVYRRDQRVVIVDFAHNEAGLTALLDVAEAIAAGLGGATLTAIIGTAGDRPDDTLRGMGRIAAQRADHIAIKETLAYLRGRTRASVLGEILAGARDGGWTADPPIYESEPDAIEGELARGDAEAEAPGDADRAGEAGPPGAADGAAERRGEVLVLLCHEDRDGVSARLAARGFEAITDAAGLADLLDTAPRTPAGVA
jgi:cyanophycin synthetase